MSQQKDRALLRRIEKIVLSAGEAVSFNGTGGGASLNASTPADPSKVNTPNAVAARRRIQAAVLAASTALTGTLVIAATGDNQVLHGGSGTPPPSGNAWTVTLLTDVPDRTIFDSGAHLGLSAATIPLAGITTAPAGSTIVARVVYFDHADLPTGTPTAWVTIATSAAGGAWSGTLSAPRVAGVWSRVEVRVSGSSAPAAQGWWRFAAGHVWALYEQSNWAHVFEWTGTLPAVLVLDPQAVQVFTVDRNPASGTVGVASRTFVTDATPLTPSVVALANAFALERPGEKLAIVAHLASGTSPFEMIQEPQTTSPRPWAHEVALNALVVASGSKVGMVFDMGWVSWMTAAGNAANILPILTGKEINGTVRNPGDTTTAGYVLTHDLREFYDYTYTRLTFCGAHGKGVTSSKTAVLGSSDTNYEQMMDAWRAVMLDDVNFPEILYCPATNDGALRGEDDGAGGWRDEIHHYNDFDWGQNRLARLGMMYMLKTVGLSTWPVPEFNRAHFDPAGAYADFWMDGRHVTTERNRTGGTSAYVRGWSINGQIITTAQIVSNAGGSGFAGVRVTPTSGVFDYTTVIDFGRGELGGFKDYPADYQNNYVLDLPVIDVGAAGMPAMPAKFRSAGQLPNTLPAPSYFSIANAVAPGPAIQDTLTMGTNGNAGLLTMRARLKIKSNAGGAIFGLSGSNLALHRIISGGSAGKIGWTAKDSAGLALVNFTSTSATLAPIGQMVDVVMSLDLPGLSGKLWVDGASIASLTLPGNSGAFAAARQLMLLCNNTSPVPDADVEALEVWNAYTSDGSTGGLGAPLKRIIGNAGHLPVETPASPAWVRGPLI